MPTALANTELRLGNAPALVVVDAMHAFTDPEHPLGSEVAPEIVVINSLLELARQRAWPVWFSTVWYEHEQEASVFRAKVPALNLLRPDSADVEIDSRLERQPADTLLRKTHASCFFSTELDGELRRQGIDSLVVCGFTTSGCVRATAVDALQYNYRTCVVSDAVQDRDRQAHQANLYDLGAKYVDVLSFADLVEQLAIDR